MSGTTITRGSISADGVQRIIEAAVAEANRIGAPMVIAIRDESGILKGLLRMDGTPLMSVEIAQDKAYTAAASGSDTAGLFKFISTEPQLLAGLPPRHRMAIFGGGVPLMDGDVMIGSVGCSGGSEAEDIQVAMAAAASLG